MRRIKTMNEISFDNIFINVYLIFNFNEIYSIFIAYNIITKVMYLKSRCAFTRKAVYLHKKHLRESTIRIKYTISHVHGRANVPNISHTHIRVCFHT